MKEQVFISSVQKELAAERRAVRDFLRGDPLLGQYFEPFLFEDLPAADQTPDQIYIDQVARSAVYLGIYGNEYGWEDAEGVSPTEREFDCATEKQKTRLVFVKGTDDSRRHAKMRALIKKAERQLTRRRFGDITDLTGKIYASLIQHLERRGVLPRRPFDAAACPNASLADMAQDRIESFLKRARAERKFAVDPAASTEAALTHLNLLDGKRLSHAAVLLFGRDPQRFLPAAETKCLHFHGTEVVKPIPSYQVFKGTLFDQVDQAVDFVLSKLDRSVGARTQGPRAAVEYEIPRPVVAEALVNAIAHRDYASAASVQVYVFADRVEIWNPGELPPSLTPEKLRHQHPSLPRNPLITESLFLAHYIEKAGTGTLDVIAGCRGAELPEPEFVQDGDQFIIRLWRDWLTPSTIDQLGLNDRQRIAIQQLKVVRRIGNTEYQALVGVAKRTAHRDLTELVEKGILERVGTTGKGTSYRLGKRATKGPNGPSAGASAKGATKGPKGPRPTRSSKGGARRKQRVPRGKRRKS